MISAMRARAAERRAANFECIQAGFLTYEHRGTPADFVYSRNALHHLPDFWKGVALTRIAAILRPGGILRLRDLVFAFEPDEAESRIGAWFETAAETSLEGWTREELEVHVREEHSTFSWIFEGMIERAGFALEEASYDSLGTFGAYLCVKRGAVAMSEGQSLGPVSS